MNTEPFLINPLVRGENMSELFLLNPKAKAKAKTKAKTKAKAKVMTKAKKMTPPWTWAKSVKAPKAKAKAKAKTKPKVMTKAKKMSPPWTWVTGVSVAKKTKKPKIKRMLKKSPKKSVKKITMSVVRKPRRIKREKRMARGKYTRYGKVHALTVYRRRRGYQVSPRARLVRRYTGRVINPLFSGGQFETVAGIAGGFVASRYLPRLFDKMLPPMLTTGIGRVGVQTATGIGLSMLVSRVFKQPRLAENIMTGALLNAAVSLVDMYLLKGVLAEEGIAALAENVPEVVSQGEAEQTLPAGFEDGEGEDEVSEQDVIVM